MKPNTVFKRAYNRGLVRLGEFALASDIGSETSWAHALSVSRTTVRSVLAAFAAAGLIAYEGRSKTLLRRPVPADFRPETDAGHVGAFVGKRFMDWILRGDSGPGQSLTVLELSRRFGVSASATGEYLNRLRRHDLLERRPNGAWILKGFTEDFAEELCEVRAMFELRSALRFTALAADDPVWRELSLIKAEHLALLREADTRFADFSELDERFHRCVNDVSRNRFFAGLYDVISMIFHYHYLWDKRDKRERNVVAIREHLAYIEALESRDPSAIVKSCNAHMATALSTLLASIRQSDEGSGAKRSIVPLARQSVQTSVASDV